MPSLVTGYPSSVRAEREWRQAFDAVPHGIAFVELDGRITDVNRPLCALLGYSPDELLERTLAELTHPDDGAEADVLFRLLDGDLETHTAEQRYLAADGAWIRLNWQLALVRDPDSGAALRWLCTFED